MKKGTNPAKNKPARIEVPVPEKVVIRKLPSGARGLDDILGGGIPEFSFNIIAGPPGCGKTTLAHQIVFANATEAKPALYFTVLGEPAIKMLRYQQQYAFFDTAKVGKAVRFLNLAEVVMEQNLDAVYEEIVKQVTAIGPGIVVVDSFRTFIRRASQHRGRNRDAVVHPAAGAVPDQLGSDDLPRGRVCAGGDSR